MSVPKERYDRQARLAEVGEAGQLRIQSTRLSVGSSASADVEALYLERAGVVNLERTSEQATTFAHGDSFEHAAPRTFAAGAWRALEQLRSVLDDLGGGTSGG